VEHAERDANDQAGERQPDNRYVVEGPDRVLLKVKGDEAPAQ